jgi:hypothetical protein
MDRLFQKGRWLPPVLAIVVVFLAQTQSRSADDGAGQPVDSPHVAGPVGQAIAEDTDWTPSYQVITRPTPARTWTIDYRVKSFLSSSTSYEVGTLDPPSQGGYSPLSKLHFPLTSTWNGLQVGLEKPNWAIHAEWLTPMSRNTGDYLADSDYLNPGELTDLGYMRERWNDGQTVTLDIERKVCDCVFGLPIEIWPVGGFRFQRFNLTAYNLEQVTSSFGPPFSYPGDIITFNQQYYMAYIGSQFRRTINLTEGKELRLIFQADWGQTWAYNVDHHLVAGYSATQRGQGDSWHLALTGEFPMSCWLTLGVQGEFLQIHTRGTDVQSNILIPRTNGVRSYSDQTSVTAFVRLTY